MTYQVTLDPPLSPREVIVNAIDRVDAVWLIEIQFGKGAGRSIAKLIEVEPGA